ncbi:46 kDa FK506-binding nuclear protein isoform X2 [Bicyclus anynana]|uniref:FK506-binding protein n=1 Tax=Bicyclus anynana TaxID=110368 RepID=A0A6J1NGL2_BICAN|nr:46 kDa FK506-binding nuclear protein isoform X2 [Bicyclus anynana]
MFWGLIMEPNKRYTQVVEKPFHISQAALDISTGDNDACQVMVVVEGKNFLVCTLQKNKYIQVPLDLYFKTGDNVSFLTNGKCNVHLTGYLDPEYEDEEGSEEEEEEEEAPALVPAKNKRKLDNAIEGTASKKAKQDKKAAKKEEPADSSDSDDDGVDQLQKFLEGEDIDTDENDDSFKVNTSAEAGSDSEEEESDDEEGEEEGEDEEEEDDEEEESDKADTTMDTSKEETEVDTSKLTKSQKKRLKKKLREQKQKQAEPLVNGIDKAKKEKPAEQQKAKKEKGEAKKDAQPVEKKEKKSLSGGVSIEDLKVGSGPVAKPGKVVMVYYEGKLKQNNKMFDNCQKGPGFKFKLGAKEVISGWDVGVAGMKVGGKRKIICPPAMAYGAKGSPPVIPPNSTLVFEVELKNVK